MKLYIPLSFLVASTQAFQSATRPSSFGRSAAPRFSTVAAPEATKTSRPERVVPEVLPEVFVYDHCPFCVRVRLALGLKNVKHNVRFMANDDVQTPTDLVGKKIAPILQWQDLIMPESLDIIDFIDNDPRFGPTNLIAPATGRTDLKAWQKGVQDLLRSLQRPRYVATGLLPEFQQLDGRHAFVKNHQLPGWQKPEWKELDLSVQLTYYAELMARDPAADIEELNRQLVALDDIVYSADYCTEGVGLSYDDIDLFSRLRSITIIQGVRWPKKLRAYMDNLAERGDIPLYDEMAL